jgi:transposase
MAKARTLVGLDVHASKVVAAMLDAETGELRFSRLPGETDRTLALCAELERPVRVAYEAGPTGFGLARALTAAGVDCVVAAPGKIPRAAQDRVKTDRRDAEHLVRLLLAGKLERVRVPSTEEEGLRDLVRAREDVRGDLMRARHRVSKMLLRHDQRFSDGPAGLEPGAPRLARPCRASRPGRPTRAARLPGVGRGDGDPSRRARAPDLRARAGLAVVATRAQAALPARDRHALGGRPLRRGR